MKKRYRDSLFHQKGILSKGQEQLYTTGSGKFRYQKNG